MNEPSEHYRKVAAQFDRRVHAVPANAWENPAPCEGWVARDVLRHLVEWIPSFFSNSARLELGEMPSVDEDPVAAWECLDAALQAALDDPDVAAREFDMRGSRYRIDRAIDTFCTNDDEQTRLIAFTGRHP